ncbi:SDR family NAD(P)-dependent oxidoreductase [Sphaerimonospora thailandensis]|uniref:Oxidoreductase n=1 Tax=Sphaerimonospora thailandensis TaxID=795644 RepID=A0A8J3R2X3_9ACTN|nr:SDR family oxidoreductase [Sphaerimonospora thailandensis]GIH68077.1 oxidoreductase [Sphaerimonospora thailandensis]
MNRFEGKNVLITGASAGIGQATAVRFIAEGATVFGLGRNAEGLKETEGMVADPSRFRSHHVDMADDASIVTAVRAAAEDLGGRIDVVCNIAGVTLATPIDDLDIDRVRTINQVNFVGPLRLISEALPHIPAGGSSAIVNVASNAATQAVPTMAAYAGSKAALVSASLTLAVELAPKRIRVVPISPSGVQTKMMWEIWEQVKDYEGDWYSRMIHLWGQQESGQAHELAAFIAFAASEEAKYWNASELRIDGGARASF